MGIQGLLGELRPVTKQVTLRDLAGKRAAIDALCWFITYCRARMVEFLKASVSVIFVFDGDKLPAKAGTEDKRAESRKAARAKAFEHLVAGRRSEAHKCFAKAIDVTPEMCAQFMKLLHELRVPFIVAPYEADAQLGYLYRRGVVDLVVSEDSDCLVYGCGLVLYKFAIEGGGDLIALEDVLHDKRSPFHKFTTDMFVDACVLMGCDYAPSLRGVGAKTAIRYAKRHGCIDKVVNAWRQEMKVVVPPDYFATALRARATFLHQRVYDPVACSLTTVTPLPPRLLPADHPRLAFLGPLIPDDVARRVAAGELHPLTKQPLPEGLRIAPPLLAPKPAAAGAPAAQLTTKPRDVLARMRECGLPTGTWSHTVQRNDLSTFVTRAARPQRQPLRENACGPPAPARPADPAPCAVSDQVAVPARASQYFSGAAAPGGCVQGRDERRQEPQLGRPEPAATAPVPSAQGALSFLMRRRSAGRPRAGGNGGAAPGRAEVRRWLNARIAEESREDGGPSLGVADFSRFAHEASRARTPNAATAPAVAAGPSLDLSRPQAHRSLLRRASTSSSASSSLHRPRVSPADAGGAAAAHAVRARRQLVSDSAPGAAEQAPALDGSFERFAFQPACPPQGRVAPASRVAAAGEGARGAAREALLAADHAASEVRRTVLRGAAFASRGGAPVRHAGPGLVGKRPAAALGVGGARVDVHAPPGKRPRPGPGAASHGEAVL